MSAAPEVEMTRRSLEAEVNGLPAPPACSAAATTLANASKLAFCGRRAGMPSLSRALQSLIAEQEADLA
jgi:hypothetical protein